MIEQFIITIISSDEEQILNFLPSNSLHDFYSEVYFKIPLLPLDITEITYKLTSKTDYKN